MAEPSEKRQKVEAVAPNIPWSAVLGQYLAPTEVGIQSGTAEMTTRFARFPKYLMVQLRRYTLTKTVCRFLFLSFNGVKTPLVAHIDKASLINFFSWYDVTVGADQARAYCAYARHD